MIRSMTGFGEAEESTSAGLVRVEIKSVNHRFFNASIRTPSGFNRLEGEIQSWLRTFVGRGHVTYSLAVDRGLAAREEELPQLDLAKATRYKELMETLRSELDLEGAVELAHIARFGEIFKAPPTDPSTAVDDAVVRRLTEHAASALVGLREVEGARLQEDLEERLLTINAQLDRIEQRAPERLVEERNRLREAVAELMEGHAGDEDRLAREIAYLAEKWDVNEELVRFRSHVTLFSETLATEPAEPVGKRLGFVIQEMNREANTIGSKANDSEISQAAVSLKEEIERLREQLENVE
jgi:uncharacterized protein (TIGR00255 family)